MHFYYEMKARGAKRLSLRCRSACRAEPPVELPFTLADGGIEQAYEGSISNREPAT